MTDALVTANGIAVVQADIVRPRFGNWHADLTVNAADLDAFQGPVSIVFADSLRFEGTALRMGVHHETVFVRVQGGKGGLATLLEPRGYTNVPLRLPLSDALREAGEALSPTADAGALGTFLPKWVRMRQAAGAELRSLIDASGAPAWRVLPDGTIWLGTDAWGPSEMDWQEIEFQPELARLEFAAEVPSVAPGQTFTAPGESYDGMRVSSVRHIASIDAVRHFVMFEEAGASTDRLKAGLEAIFRTRIDPLIDAAACYWAKVVSQNGDGSLELRFDSPKVPPLSHVPIRLGIPGASAKVSSGARVIVEFADGDLTQPIATLWGTASVTELALGGTVIKIGAGAAEAVVKGNAYRTAEDTLLTAIGAFASALQTTADPGHAAAITLNSAITTFQSAAATYLSTVSKTA